MAEQEFTGFPAGAEVTPIPNLFFASVLPRVSDIAELKAILCVFWLVSSRRGGNRFVSFAELVSKGWVAESELEQALTKAVERKVLLSFEVEVGNKRERIYLINDAAGRSELNRIEQGKVPQLSLLLDRCGGGGKTELPNIFKLYEENIGLLTPMIADELRQAEKLYPWEWIESAFREAVVLNKRSWRYISRILERWAVEGKDDGKAGRSSKKGVDREKYIRGKYGHLVKR
ncbi:MAG: DnaD domain protein [Candidatus Bathyarchaeia archaeon]